MVLKSMISYVHVYFRRTRKKMSMWDVDAHYSAATVCIVFREDDVYE